MNFDRLRFVADRAELGEGREALLSVEIPEKPGRQVHTLPSPHPTYPPQILTKSPHSFIAFHSVIHPRATTEFIYRYNSPSLAHIFVSFKLESLDRTKEVEGVLRTLEEKGMKGYDISDDEMSKSHARYMIGGCQDVKHERVFRFGGCCSLAELFRTVLMLRTL
jgi:threonine dehydratase